MKFSWRKEPDVGTDAVRRIAKRWMADSDRIRWAENGFSWWPGRFEVKVQFDRHPNERIWRLEIRTKFLRDVACDDAAKRRNLALLARLAPTYAWVYPPPDVVEYMAKEGVSRDVLEAVRGTVWFQSTAYLTEDNAKWLPDTLARLALLQPIDAARRAEPASLLVGGQPDMSDPPKKTSVDQSNDLHGLAVVIHRDGQQASKWKGSIEFKDVSAQYGKNDLCFGVAGTDDLALETPIGSTSALVKLESTVSHPWLGAGLLSTIDLPPGHDERAAAYEAMWLNYYEAGVWTLVHQFGNWSSVEVADGLFEAQCTFFIPNTFYQQGLATNVALWQYARVRWWKQERLPHLKDLTMAEIFLQRFGGAVPN
jgi:hypothetical protein